MAYFISANGIKFTLTYGGNINKTMYRDNKHATYQ